MTARRYPDFTIPTLGEATIPSPLVVPSRATLAEPDERLLVDPYLEATREIFAAGGSPASFEIAGPRDKILFDPAATCAAIATCGGISPGLNDVIRALVAELAERYAVSHIYGVRHGYNGLARPGKLVPLAPSEVETAPAHGGSILGTSRGTPTVKEIVDTLLDRRIDLFFPVGGDGTLRGALEISEEIARRGARIAVVGLPKTIDNDIPWVRRSFGFETAVRTAADAIRAAFGEATSVRNGVGLVKLMGRNAGYLAAAATLAAGVVDFCLIPEIPFALEGADGLLDLVRHKVVKQGHAIVVVAEGAGQNLFAGEDFGTDASGNPKLGDIGPRLKNEIEKHFAGNGTSLSVKYIDPSYLVRSAPAGTADSLHGSRLAQGAVHAAMSGRTGMLIGYWHGEITHVPLTALRGEVRRVNPDGALWWNVIESTGQPLTIGPPPGPGQTSTAR